MSSSIGPRQTPQYGPVDDRLDPSMPQRATPPQTRLANIPARFFQEACEYLVNIIRPEYDDRRILRCLNIVRTIVQDVLKQDLKLKRHLADEGEFFDSVKNKGRQDFIKSLRVMAKNLSWERLFDDGVFMKPRRTTPGESNNSTFISPTELAWISPFRGNAHLVLLETISDLLDKNKYRDARLASIVNSSGTGKSRMVDQLGKKIITVPMCLCPEKAKGFPPSDNSLRDWHGFGYSPYSQDSRTQRGLYEFMYALLTVTRTELETIVTEGEAWGEDVPTLPDLDDAEVPNMSEIELEKHISYVKDRQAWLASTFRDLMTTGQSFDTSNTYRKKFYDDVIRLADQNTPTSSGSIFGEKPNFFEFLEGDNRVEEAGEMLCRFVDPRGLLDSTEGPRRPLIIFAFDDAHVLTNNPITDSWNIFSELRRILRRIYKLPVFSLFISKAGRFNPSSPISEIGFDDLAHSALEDTVTLDRVTHIDWMSHIGRPLFGSYWDDKPQCETRLMGLAKWELLDRLSYLPNGDQPGSLACLSVRFALEFNTDEAGRDVACTQVERHMRLCVAGNAGLEKFITSAGSEPLLAEAAYEVMEQNGKSAVRHLSDHPDLHCIERGRRGELVATTLIMHAYDEARNKRSRWVSVSAFMKALLPPAEYDTLLKRRPTFWRTKEDKPFEETFEDYGMWFNHVIKVEDSKMISTDHLWKFVTRGAMVLLSNNQAYVDIVLPVCDTKQNLSSDSTTAILIRVKNAERFKKSIQETLFDTMSPFDLCMFPEEGSPTTVTVTPKPVIRLVLALASPEAGVVFREQPERTKTRPDTSFTAFDIWLAGLSTSTFGKIGDASDLDAYRTLLDRSLRPHLHGAFELMEDPRVGDAAKKLRGSRRRRVVPLTLSHPDHESIYREREGTGSNL